MARFFITCGTAFALIFLWENFSATAAIKKKQGSKKVPVYSESFSTWQCKTTKIGDDLENCVDINKSAETGNSGTKITGCGWKMPVFCDATINTAVVKKQAAKPTSCDDVPPGYVLFPGVGYYKVHTELKTWSEAKLACEADGKGTTLAIPSTAAEYEAITNMSMTFIPGYLDGMYVGINDFAVEGEFRTIFDQPLCTLPLSKWFGGEPHALENEDCVGISWHHLEKLSDYSCDSNLPFICEKPLATRQTVCRP